eukprot:2400319-Heterocapsa_arctica.AAC.1
MDAVAAMPGSQPGQAPGSQAAGQATRQPININSSIKRSYYSQHIENAQYPKQMNISLSIYIRRPPCGVERVGTTPIAI